MKIIQNKIAIFLIAIIHSCMYDSGIPLSNYMPYCQNQTTINKSLIYPQSTVCTLHISDLNDNNLYCTVLPCADSLTGDYPDSLEKPWPGICLLLKESYGTKDILLKLDTNLMGMYKGNLVVHDFHNAKTVIPYHIQKQFCDPFDIHPLESKFWKTYRTADSNTVKIFYIDKKLQFAFDIADSTQPRSTGLVSTFKIAGDFRINIDFRIRDEMDDGFETGFFVSTSADTGKWSGDIAGIFLQGLQKRIRLECKSVDLQSFSQEVNLFAGKLGICRSGNNLDFYCHDGNPLISPTPLTQLTFPTDSVFVHIKMNVNDRTKTRNSYWNDFYVFEGYIVPDVNL